MWKNLLTEYMNALVVFTKANLETSSISEALLGISLSGVRMQGITHRGVKMPNIQSKSSLFNLIYDIFPKF